MILTPAQIAQYAYKAGFRGDALNIAVAVALAESGGNTAAYNPELAAGTPTGSGSRGLWQIYGAAHPEYNNDSAFDPAVNARAAYQVFREAGNRFTPWSTYNQGMANPTQNWAGQVGNGVSNLANRVMTSQNRPVNQNRPTGQTTTRITTTTTGGGLAGQLQNINAGAGGEETKATIPEQVVNAVTGGRSATDLLFIALGSAFVLIALFGILFSGYASANVAAGKFIIDNKEDIAKAAALL